MFLRSILYPFSAPISTLNNVMHQKNKNFISTTVDTSTLTNSTLTSRSTSRITYQSRRPWFRSQESPVVSLFEDLLLWSNFFKVLRGFPSLFTVTPLLDIFLKLQVSTTGPFEAKVKKKDSTLTDFEILK